MTIADKIASWASQLPPWQGDALRRLLTKPELDEEDIRDLLAMLKASKGWEDPANPAPKPNPAVRSDFPGAPSKEAASLSLTAMHSLQHVNALARDQKLSFAPQGLTVVYGDNAAGKSGYSRVLKRACRARDEKERVLRNVFQEGQPQDAPEARFDILVNGVSQQEHWQEGHPSPDILSHVAVFDSRCARVHLTEANAVVYVPYGIDIFARLAQTCQKIKERLERDAPQPIELPEEIAEVDQDTQAGILIKSLTWQTKDVEIERLGTFGVEEQARLSELETILARFHAEDPVLTAKGLRADGRNYRKWASDISRLDTQLSDREMSRMRALVESIVSLKKAVGLASSKTFANEPLMGIGTDVWREFFLAAKRFSEQYAYPTLAFPVSADGAKCVLCQQTLSDDAKDRMKRFWDFLQDTSQATLDSARKSLADCVDHIGPLETLASNLHVDTVKLTPELQGMVEDYLTSAKTRITAAQDAARSTAWKNPNALAPSPVVELEALAKSCEDRAHALEKMSRPEERTSLETKCRELQARKILACHKASVLQYALRLRQEHHIDMCMSSLNTHSITQKGSQIADAALTEELRQALSRELQLMGMNHLRLHLNQTARVGVTRHQIHLPDARSEISSLTDVLSEGEQRVVAIAAFLAELSLSPDCPIVFDDPVCSLDHVWREHVAKRLVSEAQRRQVIVFTHDIVFLLYLDHEATHAQVPLQALTICREGEMIGLCRSGLPWKALKFGDRVAELSRDIDQAGRVITDRAAYDRAVGDFYGKLREAWERLVEEVVLNQTVQRFSSAIQTQRLKGVVVTDEDFVAIHRGMRKCSANLRGHDDAPALNRVPPRPDELRSDLTAIEDFYREHKKSREDTESKRRALVTE